MKKLTDQELDSIFKSAAEGYEPAFDSVSWEAMNLKLEQPLPAPWKRWLPFVLVGVFIFTTGVWVGISFDENPLSTESILKSESKELIQPEMSPNQENQDQVRIANNQTPTEKETLYKSQHHGVDGKVSNRALLTNNQVLKKSESIEITDASNLIDKSKFLLPEEKNSPELIKKVSDYLLDTLSEINVVDKVKKDTTQSISTEAPYEKMATRSHPIFLRALASPDFSSIDHASPSERGSNYSILLEYQLTNRWSITTGGIWSMKKYSTNEQVTYGKYTADRMVGACQILDIPVNIYYRFRPQLKTSFYAGIGFSSYIMLDEHYTFTIDNSSGSRDYSYYIEGKNNEWFKVLNLSVGIQYQITPRFFIQAEPFLKAPLSGVGEWDIQLSSMGIFLGVKYKIN